MLSAYATLSLALIGVMLGACARTMPSKEIVITSGVQAAVFGELLYDIGDPHPCLATRKNGIFSDPHPEVISLFRAESSYYSFHIYSQCAKRRRWYGHTNEIPYRLYFVDSKGIIDESGSVQAVGGIAYPNLKEHTWQFYLTKESYGRILWNTFRYMAIWDLRERLSSNRWRLIERRK